MSEMQLNQDQQNQPIQAQQIIQQQLIQPQPNQPDQFSQNNQPPQIQQFVQPQQQFNQNLQYQQQYQQFQQVKQDLLYQQQYQQFQQVKQEPQYQQQYQQLQQVKQEPQYQQQYQHLQQVKQEPQYQQQYQHLQQVKQEPQYQQQYPNQNIQSPPQQNQNEIQQQNQIQPPQELQEGQEAAKPQKKPLKFKLKFEELGVYRRAALGLLPNVNDPELHEPMSFSTLKSSRKYRFLDGDKLSVTLEGGYRLCRSTRFLPTDKNYYWEVDFTSAKNEESHVRIGIATIKADMEAPVGVDKNGYCFADLGKSLHNGWKTRKVKTPPFHPSDTIGVGFIPGPNSISLKLFINGVDHGIIFDDIQKDEKWTPSVSIYRDATLTGRFSRPFKFDPGDQWTAAGDIPRDSPTLPIIAKDLVKVMKGTTALTSDSELYMSAIYSALTPAHQMPI